VIRLTVMMYLRYPLSLRQVEDLLFERHRYLPRDDTVLVESLRSDVRQGDQNVALRLDHIRTGVGTWTRSSSGSMERRITYGER